MTTNHTMKQASLLLFFIAINVNAQKIEGKIFNAYDSIPLPDIKIVNNTQNKSTYSNEEGVFYISAKLNDTISFQSILFEEKYITYNGFFGKKLNIYLEEKTNELEEVTVMGAVKFEVEELNKELNKPIEEVIKNKPPMYLGKTALKGNVFKLLSVIVKVFKKDKPPERVYISIDFDFLDNLFQNNQNIYNDKFLIEVLHIENTKKHLFFNYCDILKFKISEKEFNDFILLDFLITQSENFNKQQKE